jgi:hypothetical protein
MPCAAKCKTCSDYNVCLECADSSMRIWELGAAETSENCACASGYYDNMVAIC